MIFDSLKHIDNYQGLGRVYEALKFLVETDFSTTELGKYELTDDIYYMVQEYDTKPKNVSEVHEKYIDIQLVLSGEEVIGVAPIECEKELVDAKPEKDVWHYTCDTQPMTLRAGEFMVLYPSDIHMPGATLGDPAAVHKVVVKVKA
jgi:YhcH/YjgK/YiaL family protein